MRMGRTFAIAVLVTSFVTAVFVTGTQAADAQAKTVHVKGYTKKDGTKVAPYDRKAPQKKGTTTDPTSQPRSTAASQAGSVHPSSGPASLLVGLTEDQVEERIGSPSLASNGAWNYDSPAGTLHVRFAAGVVSEVRPTDFDLGSFVVIEAPDAEGPALPVSVPHDAVARCGNGQFVFISTGDKTCKGFGGVAEWLKKQ